MKLNKIKNAFNNRKIEPSAGAWDQLASRLDQEDKKSKKPVLFWLSAIAAVLIFAILIYPVVTNDIEAVENNNEVVVEEPLNKPANSHSKEQMTNPTNVIDPSLETTTNIEAFASVTENEETQTSMSKNKKLETVNKKQKLDLTATTIEKLITNSIKEQSNKNTLFDDNSVNPELYNSIAQSAPKKLTAEEEMELLLKEAMENTSTTEVVVKQMNVEQLIREAEWDAETDRRNRVNDMIFDKLGKLKAEAFTLIDRNK